MKITIPIIIFIFGLVTAYSDVTAIDDLPSDGKHKRVKRIVGGVPSSPGEFPWMALLQYRIEPYGEIIFSCGGSLINRRYVLTAAHCIDMGYPYELEGVRLGEYDTRTDPDCFNKTVGGNSTCADKFVFFQIEKKVVHKYYDIALLRLAQPVYCTRFIKPISLPDTEVLPTGFVAAGWGKVGWGRDFSPILLKVNLTLEDHNRCNETWMSQPEFGPISIIDSQICAGGGETSVCKGDSGGPLMALVEGSDKIYKWQIFGIASHALCGPEPSVFTKVSSFVPWINETINANDNKN